VRRCELSQLAIRETAIGETRRLQLGTAETARGWTSEWHLVFANAFEDIEFGFVAWFHQ